MSWFVPPEYCVLDIETVNGEPTEAEAWARLAWSPSKTWKPATIGERYLEVVAKKEQQLALLDTAPIISVAVRTEADCRVLHWMPTYEPRIGAAAIERCASETAMLARLCGYLAACSPESLLVGHNVLHFDLPKLRRAMLRLGIRLPDALVWRDQPVFDTMREWGRFTADDRQYIGLGELLDACGLPNHKDLAGGAMVPDLYAAQRYSEILAYAVADVLAEAALFLRMTGRLPATAFGHEATGGHAAIEEAAARQVAAGPNGAHAATDPELDLESLLQTLGVKP